MDGLLLVHGRGHGALLCLTRRDRRGWRRRAGKVAPACLEAGGGRGGGCGWFRERRRASGGRGRLCRRASVGEKGRDVGGWFRGRRRAPGGRERLCRRASGGRQGLCRRASGERKAGAVAAGGSGSGSGLRAGGKGCAGVLRVGGKDCAGVPRGRADFCSVRPSVLVSCLFCLSARRFICLLRLSTGQLVRGTVRLEAYRLPVNCGGAALFCVRLTCSSLGSVRLPSSVLFGCPRLFCSVALVCSVRLPSSALFGCPGLFCLAALVCSVWLPWSAPLGCPGLLCWPRPAGLVSAFVPVWFGAARSRRPHCRSAWAGPVRFGSVQLSSAWPRQTTARSTARQMASPSPPPPTCVSQSYDTTAATAVTRPESCCALTRRGSLHTEHTADTNGSLPAICHVNPASRLYRSRLPRPDDATPHPLLLLRSSSGGSQIFPHTSMCRRRNGGMKEAAHARRKTKGF